MLGFVIDFTLKLLKNPKKRFYMNAFYLLHVGPTQKANIALVPV